VQRAACVWGTSARAALDHRARTLRRYGHNRAATVYAASKQARADTCRGGAVCRTILLHLLVSALRPTVRAVADLVAQGSVAAPQEHVCVSVNADASARSPQFWAAAVSLAGPRVSPHVPHCLAPFMPAAVSAAKAAVLLRALSPDTRAALLAACPDAAGDAMHARRASILCFCAGPSAPCMPARACGHVLSTRPCDLARTAWRSCSASKRSCAWSMPAARA
jgi:hypothetical protein